MKKTLATLTSAVLLAAPYAERDVDLSLRSDALVSRPYVDLTLEVMRRFGAVPWRFGAPDYRQYAPRQGRTLEGPAVTADWDVRLSLAMLDCGYALDEETVVETLIEDLALA